MHYKLDEAAQYLGIDRKTLQTATYEGRIGFLRISPHRTRYLKEHLDAYKTSWLRATAPIREMAQ